MEKDFLNTTDPEFLLVSPLAETDFSSSAFRQAAPLEVENEIVELSPRPSLMAKRLVLFPNREEH